MQADLGPVANRRQDLGLGEYLGIRADADFKILAPQALGDQRGLDRLRLRRTRADVAQRGADHRAHPATDRLGAGGIAAGPFLDDPFNHRPAKVTPQALTA